MKTIEFKQLDETLYYEKLENGLDVYILPKKGFSKTFVTFTTKYGSVDRTFVPIGGTESITVPDGIAHFLEHKMFEKEDGDVFQKFSEFGASANAFTSFTRTAYLFSSTNNIYSLTLQKQLLIRKRALLVRKLRCTTINQIGAYILAQLKICIIITQ